MKIIFAGTPEFAVPALTALIAAEHDIVLVLTQPDRPAGRGMKLKSSPVKELALAHGLAVFQPEALKARDVQACLVGVNADVMVVAAYGLIIPQAVLDMPKHGCLNIHASLLPRWRGAAPIQRAILAGDSETGVTIMQVVLALDAGGMLKKAVIPITAQDTAQTLHDALAALGGKLMVEVLAQLQSLTAEPQNEELVTYAEKLQKSEAPITWQRSAAEISKQVRAFNPFPVATAAMNGEIWKIWFASTAQWRGTPGEIISLDNGIMVSCGEGALCITELQKPGGKRLGWKEFLAGNPLRTGICFDT
jgi:methionyl-tRNA formyltransferase